MIISSSHKELVTSSSSSSIIKFYSIFCIFAKIIEVRSSEFVLQVHTYSGPRRPGKIFEEEEQDRELLILVKEAENQPINKIQNKRNLLGDDSRNGYTYDINFDHYPSKRNTVDK